MSRYISDQNKVVLMHESGTYATVSGNGYWIGQVTSSNVTDSEGLIETRFMGSTDRNFDVFNQGARDVTGTLTYNPSDFRIPFWAIGSTWEVTGAGSDVHFTQETDNDEWQNPFVSGTGQLNPPISFTIEDSKQSPGTGRNFIRTVNGCVPNSVTISASEGEKISVDVDYIGQTLSHGSGTTTSVTEGTTRPYLWSDTSLTLAGSSMNTVRNVSLEINNNLNAPHYVNGSRDISTPFAQNRNYTLSVGMDLDGTDADMLYREFYKGGSAFNAVLDFDADNTSVGSQHTVFTMSGCYITSMDNPSTIEGPTSTSLTIRPESVTGSAWDSEGDYNAW